jgi:hypothetical protein
LLWLSQHPYRETRRRSKLALDEPIKLAACGITTFGPSAEAMNL